MNLNLALESVAESYIEYTSMNSELIQYSVFEELKNQTNDINIEDAPCILFFEAGEIRYRGKFYVGNYYVTNDYEFRERIHDVIPYEGNPKELKAIMKEFVRRLQDGTFVVERVEEDTECNAKWSQREYPSSSAKEPINDLKTAEKIAKKAHEAMDKAIKRNKGNKMKDVFNKMLEVNKASAVNTAKVELGKTANKVVLSKVKPQLPRYMQGYADSPLAELAVANIVAGLLIQFMPDNEKAQILSEAMISAGAQVAIESLDIPGLLNDLLANVDVTGLAEDDD